MLVHRYLKFPAQMRDTATQTQKIYMKVRFGPLSDDYLSSSDDQISLDDCSEDTLEAISHSSYTSLSRSDSFELQARSLGQKLNA